MEVICKSCGRKSRLRNVDKYRGRTVKTRCTNKSCNKVIEIHIAEEKEEVTTVVTSNKKLNLDGFLKVISSESKENTTYDLKSLIVLIGRKSSTSKADIQLSNDSFVSRNHCYIQFVDKKGYLISDNKSKNGVKVNGKKLLQEDKIYLKNKDVIQIGNTNLEFNYK